MVKHKIRATVQYCSQANDKEMTCSWSVIVMYSRSQSSLMSTYMKIHILGFRSWISNPKQQHMAWTGCIFSLRSMKHAAHWNSCLKRTTQ
nr:hypothetical protein [Tanacetum cinerariifolium]